MTETKVIKQTPNGANLTDKDKIIKDLEEKIIILKRQKKDLDYKHEQERNKRLSELEAKLNQPLTNQTLLFNLLKKLEKDELAFYFEDEDNKLFLEDKNTKSKIYLFTLKIKDNDISVFYDDAKVWQKVNDKFQEKFLKEQKEPTKNNSKLTKIQGLLTSQVRPKPSSNVSAMAYLRPDKANKHSLAECEKSKMSRVWNTSDI